MNEKYSKGLRRLAYTVFCLPLAHGEHPTPQETVTASVKLLNETPRAQQRARKLAIRKGIKKGLIDPATDGAFHCGTCGRHVQVTSTDTVH